MQLNDIRSLYQYNSWASERVFNAVADVPGETYLRDLGSSHGGIHGTLVHLMGAEEIWLRRWLGERVERIARPDEFPGLSPLRSHWKEVDGRLHAFIDALAGDDLRRIVHYTDLRGNPYAQPLEHLMQHLVNHSTYHRGQVVCLLRQLNIKPPGTDMVNFFRQIGASGLH